MTERLLHVLRDRANSRGLVMVREGRLQTELKITGEELRANLKKLEESGLIEILTPGSFIVLKLRIWPGRRENGPVSSPIPHSYSFKLSPSKQLKKSYSYSGGDAQSVHLLQDILDTLGETDPSLFARAVEHYPETVIRTALDRVRSAKSIYKSPTALFRYLLPRIAKEIPPSSN